MKRSSLFTIGESFTFFYSKFLLFIYIQGIRTCLIKTWKSQLNEGIEITFTLGSQVVNTELWWPGNNFKPVFGLNYNTIGWKLVRLFSKNSKIRNEKREGNVDTCVNFSAKINKLTLCLHWFFVLKSVRTDGTLTVDIHLKKMPNILFIYASKDS